MKSLYVGSFSAFEYWQRQRVGVAPRLDELDPLDRIGLAPGAHVARIRTLGSTPPSDAQVRDALSHELRGLAAPVDLLVPDAGSRRDSALKRCCVWSGPLPTGAFLSLGGGVHVSTPKFTLLQLAGNLTEEEILKLAYELCGAYTLAFRDLRASTRCLPLTTADALRRFAGRAHDAAGIVRLRRALRFVADRSASPTETAVAALLCSARTGGGYGLPLPELNHIVDVPFEPQELTGQARIVCDAYWPRAGYVVEYDGRVGHSGDANVVKDYSRGNALTALGIPAMTLTHRELYHAGRFDRAAWQIAAALGVRLRRDRGFGRTWELRRGTLRRTFLRAEDPWRLEGTDPRSR